MYSEEFDTFSFLIGLIKKKSVREKVTKSSLSLSKRPFSEIQVSNF